MADKTFIVNFTETGISSYLIIKEISTGFFYDETDGDFRAWNSPTTDNFLALTEDTNMKGSYSVTVPNSEPDWADGRYLVLAYKQDSTSPVPASDTIISQDYTLIKDDDISLSEEGVDITEDKLPTNNIMGSSDKTDKDDEIDAIKTVTDNLPNSGALTDIDTGVNNIEAKLPTNFIMGSSDQTDKDDEIDSIKSTIDTNLDTTISSRSSHSASDVDTVLSASHGSGIWDSTAVVIGSVTLADSNTNKLIIAKSIKDQDVSATAEVSGSVYEILNKVFKIETGRWKIVSNQMIFYDDDNTTPLYTFDLKDGSGNATEDNPKERTPA